MILDASIHLYSRVAGDVLTNLKMMTCASTVLIVGGGVGGLSSAIALSRVGLRCEVVEKYDPKEGASIGISGRAADALEELGLYDRFYAAGTPFPHDSQAVSSRDPNGRLLSAGPARPKWPNAKLTVGIYRPTMIDEMMEVAKELGVRILGGVTFSKIENGTDGVSVTLTNGEERNYDFLIGADGINSATRAAVFPEVDSPVYTGQMSIRWMSPGPEIDGACWYRTPVGRLGYYNLPEGLTYVPTVFNIPEDRRFSPKELHQSMTDLMDSIDTPTIKELRARLQEDSKLIGRPFRWIMVPGPWYRNRVILVGDAAHATSAHLGMGGGMALEDSVVLAQCIKSSSSVDEAFKAFMERRLQRVESVVHTSVKLSKLEQENAAPTETVGLIAQALSTLAVPY